MNPKNFQFLAALVQRECGLVLEADKTYLAESRLAPVARQFGHVDIDGLVANIMSTKSRDSIRAVVDAMVTNETFFFRDRKPFDHFETFALPEILEARASTKQLRIWSAAASTGQEAYSLAMILEKNRMKMAGWKNDIIGTDISDKALSRAKQANYSQFEVQRGLPVKLLVQHFEQQGDRWQLKAGIKNAVRFERYNLLDDATKLGRFDVVFCRNVLIYFDVSVRRKILDMVARMLNPGGALYLGGAETTVGLTDKFQPDPNGRGVYRVGLAGGSAAAPRRALAG